jgi:hypothetical protein
MTLRLSEAEFQAFVNKGQKAQVAVREVIIAKGKLVPRKMNKLEAEYAQFLEARKHAREILWYDFECVTLRLGDDCRYTPDFTIMLSNGEIEMHETKGFLRDDAAVKIRAAAERYPFRFFMIRKIPQKQGGGWSTQKFSKE